MRWSLYHIFTFLQNIAMLLLWYFRYQDPTNPDAYGIMLICLVLGGTVVGSLLTLIYYQYVLLIISVLYWLFWNVRNTNLIVNYNTYPEFYACLRRALLPGDVFVCMLAQNITFCARVTRATKQRSIHHPIDRPILLYDRDALCLIIVDWRPPTTMPVSYTYPPQFVSPVSEDRHARRSEFRSDIAGSEGKIHFTDSII